MGVDIWVDRPVGGNSGLDFPLEYISQHDVGALPIGKNYKTEIVRAIKDSSAVLFCLSKHFSSNREVLNDELLLAIHDGKLILCAIEPLDLNNIPDASGLATLKDLQLISVDADSLAPIITKIDSTGRQGLHALSDAERRIWKKVEELAALLIGRCAEEPYNGPPLLNLHLGRTSASLQTPSPIRWLGYQASATTFVGRDDELEELQQFLDEPAPLLWHMVTGPAGSGKSRLAHELALRVRRQPRWKAGFIAPRSLEEFSWIDWKPSHDTLIIIDDPDDKAASYLQDRLLQLSSGIPQGKRRVRILLIDRSSHATWLDHFIPTEGNVSDQLNDLRWREKPTRLKDIPSYDAEVIAVDTCRAILGDAEADASPYIQALFKGRLFGIASRKPLDAMLVGAYLAEHFQERDRFLSRRASIDLPSYTGILKGLVSREVKRLGGDGDLHQATIIATILGRPWSISLAEDEQVSSPVVEPITPDLLGEYMFIRWANAAAVTQLQTLLALCWQRDADRTRSFLLHTAQDFRDRVVFERVTQHGPPGRMADQTAWLSFRMELLRFLPNDNEYFQVMRDLFNYLNITPDVSQRLTAQLISRAPTFHVALTALRALQNRHQPIGAAHFAAMVRQSPAPFVPDLLSQATETGVAFGEAIAVEVIRKTAPDNVVSVLDDFTRQRIALSRRVYIAALWQVAPLDFDQVLKLAARTCDVRSQQFVRAICGRLPALDALGYLLDFEERGLAVYQTDYIDITRRLAVVDGIRLVRRLIQLNRKPTKYLFPILLGRAQTDSHIQSILSLFDECGHELDVVMYTKLLSVVESDAVPRLVSEMTARGIGFDEFVFSILISRAPTPEEALQRYDEMSQRQIRPNRFHFAPLLRACSADAVKRLLNDMQRLGIEHDSYTLEALTSNRVLAFDDQERRQLYKTARTKGVAIDPRAYAALLRSMTNPIERQELVSEMLALGIRLSEGAYRALIEAGEASAEVKRLAEDYRDENGGHSEGVLLSALSRSITLRWRFSEVKWVYEELARAGFDLPIKYLEHNIDGATSPEAAWALDLLAKSGLSPTKKIADIIVRKMANEDSDAARKLFYRYGEFALIPDAKTLSGVVGLGSFDQQYAAAEHVLASGSLIDIDNLRQLALSAHQAEQCRKIIAISKKAGINCEASLFSGAVATAPFTSAKAIILLLKDAGLPPRPSMIADLLSKAPLNAGLTFLRTVDLPKGIAILGYESLLSNLGTPALKSVASGLTKAGIKPRKRTYDLFIAKAGSFARALAYMRKFVASKYVVDGVAMEGILQHVASPADLLRLARELKQLDASIGEEALGLFAARIQKHASGKRARSIEKLLRDLTVIPQL